MAERAPWLAQARVLVAGRAAGSALVLDEPLSFWGGLDAASGVIVDARHAQRGQRVTGRMLVMPAGRGSSSSSSVLAEAIHAGTGPAAILLARPDEVVVIGALVVGLLYDYDDAWPVVSLAPADYARIATGDLVDLGADGQMMVHTRGP